MPDAKPRGRGASDESYVIDLCDAVLDETAVRQHRFDWLRGDANTRLRVDAYYVRHELVVEYREKQHTGGVPFFDRRDTVSGVGRGEQRRIYDLRRESEIPAHGLRLVIITPWQLDSTPAGRLRRSLESDRKVIDRIFND